MTMLDNKCDCCGGPDAVGVAAVPFLPISIAWCVKCLKAEVLPFDLMAFNTAMIGGMENANGEWADWVERSITYHGKTHAEFDAAVKAAEKELEEQAAVPPEPLRGDEGQEF